MSRDASAASGRLIAMIVAIAAGSAAVAAISTAYIIIGREINAGYLATRPAAAEIQVDHLDAADVQQVRAVSAVEWADAAGRQWLRVKVGAREWLPLLLFVVPDFSAQRIGILKLDSGQWPSAAGAIVLERTAMPVANATLNDRIAVRTAEGIEHELTVTGVVHDPSLAPASQQQTVYGYATAATWRALGAQSGVADLENRVATAGRYCASHCHDRADRQ